MKKETEKIVELDLNDILPNRFQPRIKFNESAIVDLSESIKEHGLIQPIIVRPIGDKYEIVAGERRYKAAVLAGLVTIPTIVLDLNDLDSVEIALIENVQRKDLTPIEEAISYKRTLDMGYLTQEQLANKLGKSQSAIANKIRLLNLSDEVQEALLEEKISERHARSLLKIENDKAQVDLLKQIIKERLTVRKLDERIDEYLKTGKVINSDNEEKETNDEIKEKTDDEKDSLKLVENNKEDNLAIEETNEDITDISELIDMVDLEKRINEILNKIDDENENISSNEEPIEKVEDNKKDNVEDDKKEKDEIKGENDNMINNMMNVDEPINYNTLKNNNTTQGRFLVNVDESNNEQRQNTEPLESQNTGNSGINIFNAKLDDLLAPQGSSLTSQSDNFFSGGNASEPAMNTPQASSIFPTLQTQDNQSPISNFNQPSQGQQSIFNDLLKNNNGTQEQVDTDSLNKFLDPSYIDGEQKNNIQNNSGVNSDVFSKFLTSDYNNIQENTSQNSNLTVSSPSTINTLVGNTTQPTVEPNNFQNNNTMTDSNQLSINSDNLSNEDNVTPSIDQLIATENKPDLLAPMGSEANKVDMMSNGINPFQTTSNEPPVMDSPVVQTLDTNSTPLDKMMPENTSAQPTVEEQPIDFLSTNTPPAFATATPLENEEVAPVTPIIEDLNMSKLLSNPTEVNTEVTPEVKYPEEPVTEDQTQNESTSSEPASIASLAQVETNTNSFLDSSNIQPIIITDYDKQYDPVLPPEIAPKTQQVDFKQVLDMIRNLNDQIESYGYVIETEEIDLEDKYQVIFNITK